MLRRLSIAAFLFLAVRILSAASDNAPVIRVDFAPVTGGKITKGEQAYVTMHTGFPNGMIYYTLDGSPPSVGSTRYTESIRLFATATVRAIAYAIDFSESAEREPLLIEIVPFVTLTVRGYGGTISVDPPSQSGRYLSNSVVRLTAVPDPGWTFMNWQDERLGTSNQAQMTLKFGNQSVYAYFGSPITILNPARGRIRAEPPVAGKIFRHGESIKLIPIPDHGYYVAAWGGAASGAANPLIYLHESAQPISALFSPLPPGKAALTVYSESEGGSAWFERRGQPTTNLYPTGEIALIRAYPRPGWTFAGWIGDAHGKENPLRLTLEGTKIVRPTFVPGSTIEIGTSGGSVRREPSLEIYPGETAVELHAEPAPGYTFASFSVFGQVFTNHPLRLVVTNDVIVYAQFNGPQRPAVFQSQLGSLKAADETGNLYFAYGPEVISVTSSGAERWRCQMPSNGFDPAPVVEDIALDFAGNVIATANGPCSQPHIVSNSLFTKISPNGSVTSHSHIRGDFETANIGSLAISPDNAIFF